jgi:hypothetical protein
MHSVSYIDNELEIILEKMVFPQFEVLSLYSPGWSEKTVKNLNQGLNLGAPEYVAEVLTTLLLHSITVIAKFELN